MQRLVKFVIIFPMKTRDIIIGLIVAALVILYLLQKDSRKPRPAKPIVTIYVSENRTCVEPILQRFEQENNITIRRIYRDDLNGSAGFLEKIVSNQKDSGADLYWSDDPIEAMFLKERNLTLPYRSTQAKTVPPNFKDQDGYWSGFAARVRVLLVRQGAKHTPTGVEDFVDPSFGNHGVIATPLSGSQRLYVAALYHLWGADRTRLFLKKLKERVTVTPDDKTSTDLVAEGRYDFTLDDSDDAFKRIRRKEPLVMIYPDQKPKAPGALVIPDTLMLLRSAKHPLWAKRLYDYLLSPKTQNRLAETCAKIPLIPGMKTSSNIPPLDRIKTMKIDYNELARKLPAIRKMLMDWAEMK